MLTIKELNYYMIVCNDNILRNLPLLLIELKLFPIFKVLQAVWKFCKTKSCSIQPECFLNNAILTLEKFQSLLQFFCNFRKVFNSFCSEHLILFIFIKLHQLLKLHHLRPRKLDTLSLRYCHDIELTRAHFGSSIIKLNSHYRLRYLQIYQRYSLCYYFRSLEVKE